MSYAKNTVVFSFVLILVVLFAACSNDDDRAGTASEVVTKATINGTVLENDSIPSEAVNVLLYKTGTVDSLISTQNTSSGIFQFDSLAAGEYRISVMLDSIEVGSESNIVLTGNETVTITINISIVITQNFYFTTNTVIQNIIINNGTATLNEDGSYTISVPDSTSQKMQFVIPCGDSLIYVNALLITKTDGTLEVYYLDSLPDTSLCSDIASSSSSSAVSSSSITNWTGTTSEPSLNSDDYYVITNAEELAWFAEKVNDGSTDINGKLANDIVLWTTDVDTNTTTKWIPIGDTTIHTYEGIFDGQNFTINGLCVKGGTNAGLFGIVGNSGVVKNISVQNGYFESSGESDPSAAGIVALNNGQISNCHNSATVYSARNAGGIAGTNHGDVSNCDNSGQITGTITGGVTGNDSGILTDVVNTGNVSGGYAGGIAGGQSGSITKCSNSGSVRGSSYTGGIVGTSLAKITMCSNQGVVVGVGDWLAYTGGLIGYANNKGSLTESFNSASVSGIDNTGGIIGVDEGVPVENCGNSGHVSSTQGNIGGLIGVNSGTVKNTISTSDSVTGVYPGALFGINGSASVNNVYYDKTLLPSLDSAYSNTGTMINTSGMTTGEMQTATFTENLNTTNGTVESTDAWEWDGTYPYIGVLKK